MNKSIFFALGLGLIGIFVFLGNGAINSQGDFIYELEAENAISIEPPFEVETDSTASGQGFLIISKGQIVKHRRAGKASYRFDLDASQVLQVWIRVKSDNPCVNSFYLAVDGKRRMISGAGKSEREWIWIRNSDLAVEKGAHSLEIMAREELCLLDKIVLTSDPNYSPI